jgi:hypothetical protein
MATDYEALVPTHVVSDVVDALQTESATMRLGRIIRIPTGEASVPILSTAPEAGFVTPRLGGRKPIATIEWSAARLVAEEIAAVTAIPDAFIDDAGFPVWPSVRPAMSAAISKALDQATLFGIDAPSSYPDGGVAAAAQPAVGVEGEVADSLDDAMAVVEQSGLIPDGIASSAAIRPALRAEARAVQLSVMDPITYSFYGLPTQVVSPWDSGTGDAIVGAWKTSLLVGLRQDVRFDLSSDGVLLDPDGNVVISAFQDDVTLLRVFIRVGVAIGTPVGPDGTPVKPFQAASWTGSTRAASSAKASSKAS